MRLVALRLGVLSCLLGVVAAPALQVGGPEFQVNTYTTDAQENPAVCADGTGGFVVVWESLENEQDGQDGQDDGVFGQRYDAAGNPLGGEFQVNTFTPDDQNDTDVCCRADGSFVVIWESDEGDGDGDGVFGQRFAAGGAPLGGQFQVNTYTSLSQDDPAVCCADGGFVVVWESSEQDGYNDGFFGQRFAAGGAPLGAEFQVNTYTSGNQYDPAVCCATDGSFVVVWESSEQDGDSQGVFGQRYAASGAASGGEFQVNTYTSDYQVDPDICCGPGGDFIVGWESAEQDGDRGGIFAQRFSSGGAPVGPEFQVNTYTSDYQGDPRICCGDGSFVLIWESAEQDGEEDGIFAQGFNSSGQAAGVEFQVNAYTIGDQDDPDVACAPGGEVLVVWEGGTEANPQDGSFVGIYARLFVEPLSILEVPTLGPAGLLALAGLLGFGAVIALRRR